MSFRKYGGLNYNAKHNNVTSNYNSANKLNVMDFVGQDNSNIVFESDIIAKGGIRVVENVDISGNLTVDGITNLNNLTYINDALTVNGTLTVNGESDFNNFVNIDASANINGLLNVNSIVLTSDQITANVNGVVPKSYVDAIASGVNPVNPCSCATTPTGSANLNLSALSDPFIVDDYVVLDGNRVLVKNQDQTGSPADANYSTNSVNNGIYVYNKSARTLTRASDYADGESVGSTSTFIQNGNINSKIIYLQVSTPAIVGIDPLQYAVFYTVQLNLGNGLEYVNGDTLQVESNLNFLTNITFAEFEGSSSRSINFSGNSDTAIINFVSTGDSSSYLQIGTGDNASSAGFDEPIYFTQREFSTNITYPRMRINQTGVYINPSGDPKFPNNASSYELNVNGNLVVSGGITSASPGTVLLTKVYSYQLPAQNSTQNIRLIDDNIEPNSKGSYVNAFTTSTDFVPKNVPYATYLFIEIGCLYFVVGYYSESAWSRIDISYNGVSADNRYIGYGYQYWEMNLGGGTRSGTIFPISAPYNLNANWTKPIQITAQIWNNSTDDPIELFKGTNPKTQNFTIKVTQIVS